jgi:5-methylcytosine-specific restriction endonuclease McrA
MGCTYSGLAIMSRLPINDSKKSTECIKKQLRNKLTCSLEGCKKPISIYEGTGSDAFCRSHQLDQREYGGMGQRGRPYTFHRRLVCDMCGLDPADYIRKVVPGLEKSDSVKFSRAVRSLIVGDHIIRKTDGGKDTADNIQSLCQNCNVIKGAMHDDWQRSQLSEPPTT